MLIKRFKYWGHERSPNFFLFPCIIQTSLMKVFPLLLGQRLPLKCSSQRKEYSWLVLSLPFQSGEVRLRHFRFTYLIGLFFWLPPVINSVWNLMNARVLWSVHVISCVGVCPIVCYICFGHQSLLTRSTNDVYHNRTCRSAFLLDTPKSFSYFILFGVL